MHSYSVWACRKDKRKKQNQREVEKKNRQNVFVESKGANAAKEIGKRFGSQKQ